jgi:dipeptidyl aminopeptidase/acylaminoacyl peptidase
VPVLSLADVLAIRHPERPAWSLDGARLAFPYLVDGRRELWTVGADAPPTRASGDGRIVGAFDWGAGGQLAYAAEKTIWLAGEDEPLLAGLDPVADLRYAPGGERLAVLRNGRLTLLGPAGRLREIALPGAAQAPLTWSPQGGRIALPVLDGGQRDLAVVDAGTGEVLWRTRTADPESGAGWIGEDRLSFQRTSLDSTRREWLIADLATGAETVVERQESERGFGVHVPPVVSPDGAAIAYTWPVDGWMHVVVCELRTGTRTVVLPGAHEDLGTETERPCFSPDGRSLAFASSHGDLRQRHIWRYDLGAGSAPRRLTAAPGTHCDPVWSPDGGSIACIACGPRQSPEVALIAADGAGERLLTASMPEAWGREQLVEPEHVLLRSADGMQVHADLFVPADLDRSRRHPALVFVHGGPSRQMRYGWHPMHSYAVFYAFNQLLLQQGYVVISVDYRGGTGYGLDYEQANYLQFAQGDVDDCVAGAEHLKALPFVDPARVGIWGLSYGGYMTLAALTKRPDVFAMGINIAGIWDFEQWARWIHDRNPGLPVTFERRWGGPKAEANAEAYRQMSPKNFASGLRAPLLNLHGTADANVDFAQLDAIVRDCTALGKDFAALHYPEETHMFTKRVTWEDAFRRMVAAFDRYLRCEPDHRPRAMI